MTNYITINLFRVIIPLKNTFITVQRIQVICMFPSPCSFSFGAVHSANENHLSADTNVAGIVRYLVNNFSKTRNCVAASL